MASNINSQNPPQQISEVNKSSSDQMNQPNPNAIAEQQKYLLDRYWNYQRQLMDATEPDHLKKHEIPLARIKKIMKADEDVMMISTEAPILFSKACEFFIQELTIKAWLRAEHRGHRTLRKDDIVEAIKSEPLFYEFLYDEQADDPGEGGDENEMSGHEMNDVAVDGGLEDEMDVDDGAAN